MLEAFGSVGVETYDLTLTTGAGGKADFRRALTTAHLLRALRRLLAPAETARHNVIVRPHAAGPALVQLDDLTRAAALARVRPAAFLVLATSPGNHQAWVAVSDLGDADFVRRLKQGIGADPTASGAARIAGSLNFKEKYAPDYPRVAIVHRALKRVVTTRELHALQLVAPPEAHPPRVSPIPSRPGGRPRIWPDYQRCVAGAPRNHGDTGPDISRADFTWCRTALAWGFGVEEVAARLLAQSGKARAPGQGERYARLTAERAAASILRDVFVARLAPPPMRGSPSGRRK